MIFLIKNIRKRKLIKSNEIEKDITEERFNDIEAKTKELFQKH